MAYDKGIAERLRELFADISGTIEKKMFGGITFMVSGHMACGVIGETLMVRVGPQQYEAALALPHAREMDFTGKALKGFVYVDAQGCESDASLAGWVEKCLDFVRSLPPK